MRTTCPVAPPVCYAAKRNPWLDQNTHATDFLCSIVLICLICWLKIVMIIHVSFCTTCRKFRMWVLTSSCQKYYLGNNNKKRQTSSPLRARLPVRFANALLEELKKIIYANNMPCISSCMLCCQKKSLVGPKYSCH